MNRIYKVRLALVLTGILVLLFAITSAGAQPKAEAVVTISADQNLFAAQQDVLIHVTISNPTNHTIRVLQWYTPVEGVEEPLFKVSVDGVSVAYTGPIYKRPAATGQDFITLKAGESVTSDVSLGQYYDLSASGAYTVIYDVSSWNLTNEKGGGPDQSVESLTSNPLLLGIEGRQALVIDFSVPDAVTGSTSFNKCTTTQQTTLLSARTNASNYASDSLSYLNANKTGSRYTTWFGIVTTSRYSTVKTHFSAISSAMDNASVTFDCGCKKKNVYAYVYANQPYKIYLCGVFWQTGMTGTDSKAGTLIHEMSHFTVVAGTDDYVYGQSGAKSLAISDPAKAVDNADNHEYFAENTPALP